MATILRAHQSGYKKATTLLETGKCIALPTETIYGLAARADSDKAVSEIFTVKNRPMTRPLSICIFSPAQAQGICQISPLAATLIKAFWPGPLTLVMPLKQDAKISQLANAHLPSIGLRCPDIAWRKALPSLGFHTPLALTSANISGRSNCLTTQDVNTQIGAKIPLIIDGGSCKNKIASTVISINGDKAKLLRAGALNPDSFAPYGIDWQSS